MTYDDLKDADEAVLEIIVSQGEARLQAQCSFADAQDQRSNGIISVSTTLAAAAAGVCAGAFSQGGQYQPLTVAAGLAALGFSISAGLALWANRSTTFHPPGFYPDDFVDDIHSKKSLRQIKADFALELEKRLRENSKTLHGRGTASFIAMISLLVTPVVALIIGLIAA